MGAAAKPCTVGAKHKWVHVRDITTTNTRITPRGTMTRMSARGEYKCACGAVRHGRSVGGL